jgi:hypothetical protein
LDDILGKNEGFALAIEQIKMGCLEMGIEGGAVSIDFVEKNLVASFNWNQHIEALTSRFKGARVLRIFVYEFSERRQGTWLQGEIHGDGKGTHLVASRTFQ